MEDADGTSRSGKREMVPALDRNLDARPESTPLRTLVEMRLRGLSGAEIARRLGISRQAVSQRLQGALALLDGDRLEAYRAHRVALLEQIEERLLCELVNPDRAKKATLGNVAYAFTQVHQARRLEANQSTANVALSAIVEAAMRDRLERAKGKDSEA